MPVSDVDPGVVAGQKLAIAAEALFLINLMAAPGIAFVTLAWLWLRHRRTAPPVARCHLDQAFFVSLWGGVLIIIASASIVALGGLTWAWTWVTVILYFTCIHSTLIVLGCIGLARAMAGRMYRFPLIGVRYE